MSDFVSSKFILLAGLGVLAVCMYLSISLTQAFVSLEEKANSPLFPRSSIQTPSFVS